MKKDTLLSISKRTGYSVSTVSRVLAGKGKQYRIGDKTIDYITGVARSCNYTPDLIAQSLRTRKTNTIGLTIPSIDNPFFATLSGVIINHLKSRGYNIILSDTMECENNETEALNSFLSRKVDGIIAVPVSHSPAYLESVSRSIPLILIDRYFEDTTLPYVCTDNYSGGYMATEHLINKGYRNILAIQGVRSSMPNKERLRGFLQAVADHEDLGVTRLTCGDSFSVENGYNEMMAAFDSGFRPDAVFAFSTTILLGVIKAVRELGLKIPDDVAVISFDNNRFLDYLDPSVTRVEQPVGVIGKLVADNIVKMVESDDRDTLAQSQILIRPTLIEGRSC
ncbi:MAG: LacI family DNA-binding transcriptional regulator [Bacteroidales bacterium]|nr:LacI family DNA-binding transcriptional regulator [Bacteroidales bacterium]